MSTNVLGAIAAAVTLGALAGACLPAGTDTGSGDSTSPDSQVAGTDGSGARAGRQAQGLPAAEPSPPIGG
ncbi:hypothetical protein [Novosphingobium sp.]|uniref:hypothetical protein n=1 Tax=Novosphingobium sp. TaxID=1874826 RepID=UPI001C8F3C4C|nr:hypothetical protein [Novosphingobium sp.]